MLKRHSNKQRFKIFARSANSSSPKTAGEYQIPQKVSNRAQHQPRHIAWIVGDSGVDGTTKPLGRHKDRTRYNIGATRLCVAAALPHMASQRIDRDTAFIEPASECSASSCRPISAPISASHSRGESTS